MNTQTSLPASRPQMMTARTRAITFVALVVVAVGGGIALVGGHPRSNWIYPFTLAIAAWGLYNSLRKGARPIGAGDNPPASVQRAVMGAIGVFVLALVVMYVYCRLLWSEAWADAPAAFVSVMTAVNYYRQKRGHDYATWPTVVLLGVMIIGMIVAKAFGFVIGPHIP